MTQCAEAELNDKVVRGEQRQKLCTRERWTMSVWTWEDLYYSLRRWEHVYLYVRARECTAAWLNSLTWQRSHLVWHVTSWPSTGHGYHTSTQTDSSKTLLREWIRGKNATLRRRFPTNWNQLTVNICSYIFSLHTCISVKFKLLNQIVPHFKSS